MDLRLAYIFLLGFLITACSEKPSDIVEKPPKEDEVIVETQHLTSVLPTKISFNEHIQPILSASCYHCHGPDSGTRYPKNEPLRLDQEDGVFEPRKNGKPVIVKGDPDQSYLMQLMESDDKDLVMPPHPSTNPHGKIMDPQEIAMVRQWIADGANFEDHWAYIAPTKSPLPAISAEDWARNPVDYFIAKKLEDAGLKPNNDQNKARLFRRLHFDLTGLPPDPKDYDTFLNDSRDFDIVYEEKVDQLLNTPAYAEHFARHWLDVARYADTHGIHIDNYRSIWPYRDWVINAFRSNMPFDQFTREQIAGDMMPNATVNQKIASGFHRCLPTTGEGGAIAEEYDAIYAQDRVDTTSSAWLGLTAGCAACHDHKFDAITTKENYQLTAFFRNTTMKALDRNSAIHPPNLLLFDNDEDEAVYANIDEKIQLASDKVVEYKKINDSKLQEWINSDNRMTKQSTTNDSRILKLSLTNKSKGIEDNTGKKYSSSKSPTWVNSPEGDAIQLESKNTINLGELGDFENKDSFSFGAWFKLNNDQKYTILSKVDQTNNMRGYDLSVENGKITVRLIHHLPNNFIKITTRRALPKNKWNHIMITYNGTKKAYGVKIYINGSQERLNNNNNSLSETIKTTAPLSLGLYNATASPTKIQLHSFGIFNKELNAEEINGITINGRINVAKSSSDSLDKITEDASKYFFTTIDPKAKTLNDKLVALKNSKSAIERRGTYSLIMEEREDQNPTAHVLIRGQYADKDEEVLSPGVPASLPQMTDDMPKNRLGLAMWLTDPSNPLPARVTVNRYWYYLFGTGIVESTNDFGVMGARPTHPKLLDWLASDFVENNWNFHHLIKTIVCSSTYRQSAVLNKEKLEKDPLNKLLSRSPRYRLDAEQIRDLALKASGLLHDKIGGPSVKPYQPDNIWSSVAMPQSNTKKYTQDTGNNLYRRSLYTFWKRTAPHPSMEILNAPSREISCVRRELTNTPLQAFVVMNDPQFVECSRQLATQALMASSNNKEILQFIASQLLNRELTTTEIDIVMQTHAYSLNKFQEEPDKAHQLIAVGESKAPSEIDPPSLAAWTLIANQILNMDETLNK